MYKITWWRRGRIRLTLYVRGGPENRTTGGARPIVSRRVAGGSRAG